MPLKVLKLFFNNLYPAKANDRLWRYFLSAYVTFDTGDLNNLSSLLYDEGEVFGGVEKIATKWLRYNCKLFSKRNKYSIKSKSFKIDYSNNKAKLHIMEQLPKQIMCL